MIQYDFEKWYQEVLLPEEIGNTRSLAMFAYSEGFYKATESMQAKLDEKDRELEKYKQGFERYETARLMDVNRWQDAFLLNIRTGKPFDQIIDDLKPFYRPQSKGE